MVDICKLAFPTALQECDQILSQASAAIKSGQVQKFASQAYADFQKVSSAIDTFSDLQSKLQTLSDSANKLNALAQTAQDAPAKIERGFIIVYVLVGLCIILFIALFILILIRCKGTRSNGYVAMDQMY